MVKKVHPLPITLDGGRLGTLHTNQGLLQLELKRPWASSANALIRERTQSLHAEHDVPTLRTKVAPTIMWQFSHPPPPRTLARY